MMKEKLAQLRELMTNHWTSRAYARDKNGMETGVDGPDACKWCLFGALLKIRDNELLELVVRECKTRYRFTPEYLNDKCGQESVLNLIKELEEHVEN